MQMFSKFVAWLKSKFKRKEPEIKASPSASPVSRFIYPEGRIYPAFSAERNVFHDDDDDGPGLSEFIGAMITISEFADSSSDSSSSSSSSFDGEGGSFSGGGSSDDW